MSSCAAFWQLSNRASEAYCTQDWKVSELSSAVYMVSCKGVVCVCLENHTVKPMHIFIRSHGNAFNQLAGNLSPRYQLTPSEVSITERLCKASVIVGEPCLKLIPCYLDTTAPTDWPILQCACLELCQQPTLPLEPQLDFGADAVNALRSCIHIHQGQSHSLIGQL